MADDLDDDGCSDYNDDFDEIAEPAIIVPPPAFDWSPEQRHALAEISLWRNEPGSQLFRLFGVAGSGKTTLTREIARRVKGEVLFCAFTGKASLVLRQMGCVGAQTIHSSIYRPVSEVEAEAKALKSYMDMLARNPQDDDAIKGASNKWGTADFWALETKLMALRNRIEKGPQWSLREKIDPEPDVIIVDECSMVNEALALDLMGFGHKILVIGDPFQLPPVRGPGYFIDAEPDAMLREVHRQALGNPIIAMATTVRQEGALALAMGQYGASGYTRQTLADSLGTFMEADQVLCGTHKTRHFCNAMIRAAKGYDPAPMPTPGEKVICCHNNRNLGLLNGSMWRVISCRRAGDYFRAEIEPWEAALRCEEAKLDVFMHRELFNAGEPMPEDKRDAEQFTWGYCITAHKAQGSQWPHVAVINDSWPGPNRFQDRWMYTAITRAQERVTIIKPQEARRPAPASRGGASHWLSG
jgi:hypothetical protein